MSEGWRDVLDEQLWIYRFWRSDIGERWGRGFMQDVLEKRGEKAVKWMTGEYSLASVEISKLLFADPIYVSDEMFTIAEAAVAADPPFQPEPLEESDLVTQNGFMVLPRPFITPDVNGRDTAWRAISWMPASLNDTERGINVSGIHVSAYTFRDDWHLDAYREGAYELEKMGFDLRWSMLYATPWLFGEKAPEAHTIEARSWWGPLQVMFRLMMQQIATRRKQDAPRHARKRWGRELPDVLAPKVLVVKLRRPKHKHTNGDGREIEWSHRWLVGGHWRNQWFPSLQAHRQIWIADHIKGPEDKPLWIRKARAFELVQ